MTKWINYHHLIYFKHIAQLGSISKASEVLGVGQPALSFQLKKLEEYIGLDLFERKKRKLFLTEAGKLTLEYAQKIDELGQEFLQVIETRNLIKRIHLNLGAQDAVPKHLVSTLVDFAHKKTGCYLAIVEGPPSFLLRELETHSLDVLITDHDLMAINHHQFFSHKILQSPVAAYGAPSFHSLAKGFPLSLNGRPAILPTHHSRLRAELEHYLQLNHIVLDRVAEIEDSMMQKILAMKGDGIIFLPEFAAHQYLQEGKLTLLGKLPNVVVEFFFITSKKLIGNEALDLMLKQNFQDLSFFT